MKRSKLITWALCGLLGTSLAKAQPASSFQFGLVGGVNAALIKNRTGYQGILWRYNAGIAAEQRFTGALSLACQLLYSRQGEIVHSRGYTPASGPLSNKQIIHLDYIALPLILRVRPKGERAFLQGGGQVGYLVNNTFQLASQPTLIQTIRPAHAIDWGLTGGLGYRLGSHLVVDARYYYGMRSVRANFTRVDPQTGAVELIKRDPWYNRVWSVNLSYCL